MQDVRVRRGADIASDHYLVVAAVQIKLQRQTKKKMQKALDIDRLKKIETQQQFQLELKNRFSLLEEQATDDKLGIED